MGLLALATVALRRWIGLSHPSHGHGAPISHPFARWRNSPGTGDFRFPPSSIRALHCQSGSLSATHSPSTPMKRCVSIWEIRRSHAVTGQFACDTMRVQDPIDRFVIAYYRPEAATRWRHAW